MVKSFSVFLFCISLIVACIFVVGPFIDRMPFIQPFIQLVDEGGMDAGALYYTEIEEFSTSILHMEHTMEYSPGTHLSGDISVDGQR